MSIPDASTVAPSVPSPERAAPDVPPGGRLLGNGYASHMDSKDAPDNTTDTQLARRVRPKSFGDRMTSGVDAGFLGNVMKLLEWAVAALLVVMTVWGVVALAMLIGTSIWNHALETRPEIYVEIIDATLIIFIVVELFRIAVAYVQHRDVVPTVMEAALVAVARKVLVIDPGIGAQDMLFKGIGLGLLIVAIGVTWYLLRLSGVGLGRREVSWMLDNTEQRAEQQAAADALADPDEA
jgi:uncharacterized membrane protein (DUF373 family)